MSFTWTRGHSMSGNDRYIPGLEDAGEAKSFRKVTVGFVTQVFERGDDGVARCVSQSFEAGDQCDYETDGEDGTVIALDPQDEEYCKFEMKQPFEPGMGGCGHPWHSSTTMSKRESLPVCPVCGGTFMILPEDDTE